jgi:hypothetical protein
MRERAVTTKDATGTARLFERKFRAYKKQNKVREQNMYFSSTAVIAEPR